MNTNTSTKQRMTRNFIRTVVKKSLNDIKDAPGRNTRNLVDMALTFTNGRFQKNFFEATQELLSNQNSAYYELVQDIALNVDTERILTFGINIGYTSCTVGAETIRTIEENEHFNIPWALTLKTDLENHPHTMQEYQLIIEQGKSLGIFTWLIFSTGHTEELLLLMEANPDCAFVLFCRPEEITENVLTKAATLYNLMFSIEYHAQTTAAICSILRQKKYLYSIHISCHIKDTGVITSGGFFSCVEAAHPAFTLFVPDAFCPNYIRRLIYNYVKSARTAQLYQTIPLDLAYDSLTIDSVISNDSCSVVFDSSGDLLNAFHAEPRPEYNIFEHKLSDILKQTFPKSTTLRQAVH